MNSIDFGVFYSGKIPIKSIGDTLGLTYIVDRLYKTKGLRSKILTTIPEIFLNNPFVDILPIGSDVKNHLTPCLEYSCNIIEHYSTQFNLEIIKNSKPILYVSQDEINYAKNELKEFSSIKKIAVNSTNCVVFLDSGKIILHGLNINAPEKRFPENENEKQIVSFALTAHFLIYIESNFKLVYYKIDDAISVLEFKKEVTISQVNSNFNGTKLILIDNSNQGYLFLSREEVLKPIPEWPSNITRIIWDAKDNNLFTILKDDKIYSYIIVNSINGIEAKPVLEYLSLDQKDNSLSITLVDRSIKPI
jgi:hypothetical protein